MLDLNKYDKDVINILIEKTEKEVEIDKENQKRINKLNNLKSINTNFETEIKAIYDKQYMIDAIKDLFIKYDFTFDIKTVVELKLLGHRNFQIAEKVGKGQQAISNTLARPEVKDFFNDYFALRAADDAEKRNIGNTIAINKLLELMNSKDERIVLAAAKIFYDSNKDINAKKEKVTVPNNAVALDMKKLGYKNE